MLLRERNSVHKTLVCRLSTGLVVDHKGDIVGLQGLDDNLHDGQLGNVRVCHDEDLLGLHVDQVLAHLAGDTFSESHGRRGHLKGVLVLGVVVAVVGTVLSVVVVLARGVGCRVVALEDATGLGVGRAGARLVHKRDQGLDRRLGRLRDSDSGGHGFF